MTIIHPRAFNQMRTAGNDGLFDWDFLRPAWEYENTRIEPMDIDAMVERCGRFLMFETKAPGVPLKRGQYIALQRLVRLGCGSITLINLKAKHADDVDGWEVWRFHRKRLLIDPHFGTAYDLVKFCHRWFEYASGHKLAPIYRSEARDLFRDLMTDPVEAATLYLERLDGCDRDDVLERFRVQP